MRKKPKNIFVLLLILLSAGGSVLQGDYLEEFSSIFNLNDSVETNITLDTIPAYSDELFVEINNNVPYFEDYQDLDVFEEYASLDEWGRAQQGYALVGEELMPTEQRGDISSVIPTGYQVAVYDCVSNGYLYHRSHLLGFQLTGENANELNLITGTQSMNVEGMLPFENLVAGYVEETGNHVLYRVTAIYEGDNLVASGVLMEAMSYEDQGDALEFCVYVYNNQPGIEIDYSSGDSYES
ncbi:DNA/RNA non-specific endonuclease [Tannockella kyphosi]|uniref:DNA/RNA non-specific endonuclease n=1 Tax=Tannockella kyphosi TaxID=2899121 RepID=UPI0020124796|nr:DNA/RNA non-specific endonuclease [Tannockella kyphosi]